MSELVTPDTSGPVPVARVAGEIDLANAARMCQQLETMAAGADGLIVDLTEVSYLDSAGVKGLFQVARALRQRDQSLIVTVAVGSPIRRVLKIASFHEVATICDDIDAAFRFTASQHRFGR